MSFDLDAYLARIRLPARPTLDALGLAAVQRAHRLAIPFENLDIRLGRGIRIDSEVGVRQARDRRRGGYCFEQNRLFGDALAALGFTARPLLARVWLGASDDAGLTHMLLLVTIDGQDWIADAGFGGSYSPPMPLVDGAEADGARRRDASGWRRTMRRLDAVARRPIRGRPTAAARGEGWVDAVQLHAAPRWRRPIWRWRNHWTATAPGTRFARLAVVSIVAAQRLRQPDRPRYRRHARARTAAGEDRSIRASIACG